jgi:hypothetical protein
MRDAIKFALQLSKAFSLLAARKRHIPHTQGFVCRIGMSLHALCHDVFMFCDPSETSTAASAGTGKKVNFSLEHAMKAQRGIRGIAVLFL